MCVVYIQQKGTSMKVLIRLWHRLVSLLHAAAG
jgi:hypothetical protein